MTLEQLLQQLKFDHLADQLETVCELAANRDLDYRKFLAEALRCEWAGRQRRGIDSQIKQARLPWLKTLE